MTFGGTPDTIIGQDVSFNSEEGRPRDGKQPQAVQVSLPGNKPFPAVRAGDNHPRQHEDTADSRSAKNNKNKDRDINALAAALAQHLRGPITTSSSPPQLAPWPYTAAAAAPVAAPMAPPMDASPDMVHTLLSVLKAFANSPADSVFPEAENFIPVQETHENTSQTNSSLVDPSLLQAQISASKKQDDAIEAFLELSITFLIDCPYYAILDLHQ